MFGCGPVGKKALPVLFQVYKVTKVCTFCFRLAATYYEVNINTINYIKREKKKALNALDSNFIYNKQH